MHKSISIAVIALFLIASPSIMFGTSNSNLFSKAMAIEEEDRSATGIIIKSNEFKDKGTSDGDKDKTSFIKTNQVKDDNDEDKSKSSDATKSSDTTDNLKNPEVQRVAGGTGVPELQCDECVEYWALAIQFLSKEQGITISEAFEQFAAYFIAALPDSLNSQETKIAVDLMDCVKERALSLIATEKSQPIVEETSLQTQKSQAQTIEGSQQQQSTQQQNLITQKQMQQEQPFEKLQLLPLVGQSNQNNEAQQMTKQSQKDNQDLSVITQEKMQNQQYENFKQLMSSVKEKYHSIEIQK